MIVHTRYFIFSIHHRILILIEKAIDRSHALRKWCVYIELPESEMEKMESFDYNDKLKEHNRIKQLVNQQIQQRQEETAMEN